MPEESIIKTSQYLGHIAESLDISETEHKKAEDSYKAIGEWLGGEGSSLAVYSPTIYPQGSFRLGTVVKPIGSDEYDIDLVCHLSISSTGLTPAILKKMVGDRLKQNGTYMRMIEEKNRCWRLRYAGEYHMDISPAIPDTTRGNNAILISDKKLANWCSSNPKGYADWFAQRMIVQLKKLAEARRADVEQLPIYSAKTPLQKAIQLLKRHRDIRFIGHTWEDDKPLSIIITTLAARIYQNEPDIYSTMINIVSTLASYAPLLVQGGRIEERIANMKIIEKSFEGRWYVPNPVNPEENFADKWNENDSRKAKAFFRWVEWLQADLGQILSRINEGNINESLKAVFGATLAENILNASAKPSAISQPSTTPHHVKIENPSKPWSFNG